MTLFDRLHENCASDNELLHSNDEKGDDFTKARDVDFGFKTPDKSRADDLCEYLNGKNFGNATVNHAEGDDLYWVISVIHMPITQHVLCATSGFMLCLSRLFGVEYDGWGSIIQTPSHTAQPKPTTPPP